MNILNAFSGKSFTKRIPSKAPMLITGSIMRFSENELHVMLSHAKIWKGTFRRFTTRKNQALMPMYSIFSLRMESRYTDMTGPAALPIIVVNPPRRPNRAEYHHFFIHLFSLPNISLQIMTAIAKARVRPMSWRKPWAGISLSTKIATRKPNRAVGNSFATTFQSAMRL